MEVDSGAVRSVIHVNDFQKLFPNLSLQPVNFKFKRVLTGQKAKILGQINAIDSDHCVLPLPSDISKSKW